MDVTHRRSPMTRSLTTAIVFLVGSAGLWTLAYRGLIPPEPWDVYAFMVPSLGFPLAALATTLAFVGKELRKPWGLAVATTSAPWQSVAAAFLAFALFLAEGALFLAPFQH